MMNLASGGRLTWRHGVDASEEKLPSTQNRGGDRLLAAQVLLKCLERKKRKQKHQTGSAFWCLNKKTNVSTGFYHCIKHFISMFSQHSHGSGGYLFSRDSHNAGFALQLDSFAHSSASLCDRIVPLNERMNVEYSRVSEFAHFAALFAELQNNFSKEQKCACASSPLQGSCRLTWHSSSHVLALCTAAVGTASGFVRSASAYSWRMSSSKWEQKTWDKNVGTVRTKSVCFLENIYIYKKNNVDFYLKQRKNISTNHCTTLSQCWIYQKTESKL